MSRIERHFAVGLVVDVRDGAVPPDCGSWTVIAPKGRTIDEADTEGTFEVAGWWWNPEDLVVVG